MEKTTKQKLNIKFILSICLVILCCMLFLTLAILAAKDGNLGVDKAFIEFSLNIRNKVLTGFLKVFTYLGDIITLAILTIVVAIFVKPILVKIFSVINLCCAGAFSVIVKYLIKRSRPIGVSLIEETGYSFPSAHALISVVFYGFLIFLIWKFLKNKPLKIILTVIIVISTLIVAYSRIYLGVHYFTDVIAAIIIGIAYLISAVWAYIFIENKIKQKKNMEKNNE